MSDDSGRKELPEIVQQYIKRLARRVSNRHMRKDVLAELHAHFADALADIPQDFDREELAASLVSEFGDTKLLARLIKRAKKRCRPLWVKFVIRTCQALILLILIFAGYTWWFVTGEPTIRVDYVAKVNEMARPKVDESLNAAPYYRKAGELYVSPSELEAREEEKQIEHSSGKRPKRLPPRESTLGNVKNLIDHPGCTLKPEERQALDKWIEANQPAIDQLRLGTAKPYCWFRYSVYSEAKGSRLMDVILPYVQGLRAITNALSWQMQFSVEEGNWESVAGDLKSIKIVAWHLMKCPFLIEQVVGMAIDKKVNDQLIRLLRNYHPSEQTLDRLAVILAESFPAGYPIADSGCETLFLLDSTQRLFTDDGSGDGHLIPSRARNLFGYIGEIKNTPSHQTRAGALFEDPIRAVELSILHPSRRQTVELIEKWKEMADSYRWLTPYQNYISGQPFQAEVHRLLEENPRNLFIETLLPGTERVLRESYAGQAKHEAAQTIVALLRYKSDHGQFPDSLDQLVPQYLEAVPQDPFGPGPLTYKRQGDDFVLHRLSPDFKDNGSKYDPVFGKGADDVFWPPLVE